MIRRPPRSTQSRSSAASDVYKRQLPSQPNGPHPPTRHAAHTTTFPQVTAPPPDLSGALGVDPGPCHSELLSWFRLRLKSWMAAVGSRVAARRAAAMLPAPDRRSAVVAMLRMAARTAGALPVRTLLASSPKVTSRT